MRIFALLIFMFSFSANSSVDPCVAGLSTPAQMVYHLIKIGKERDLITLEELKEITRSKKAPAQFHFNSKIVGRGSWERNLNSSLADWKKENPTWETDSQTWGELTASLAKLHGGIFQIAEKKNTASKDTQEIAQLKLIKRRENLFYSLHTEQGSKFRFSNGDKYPYPLSFHFHTDSINHDAQVIDSNERVDQTLDIFETDHELRLLGRVDEDTNEVYEYSFDKQAKEMKRVRELPPRNTKKEGDRDVTYLKDGRVLDTWGTRSLHWQIDGEPQVDSIAIPRDYYLSVHAENERRWTLMSPGYPFGGIIGRRVWLVSSDGQVIKRRLKNGKGYRAAISKSSTPHFALNSDWKIHILSPESSEKVRTIPCEELGIRNAGLKISNMYWTPNDFLVITVSSNYSGPGWLVIDPFAKDKDDFIIINTVRDSSLKPKFKIEDRTENQIVPGSITQGRGSFIGDYFLYLDKSGKLFMLTDHGSLFAQVAISFADWAKISVVKGGSDTIAHILGSNANGNYFHNTVRLPPQFTR